MEQKDRNPGIHGVVADLLQAEKKYETAIETALGGSIQNIVTDYEAGIPVFLLHDLPNTVSIAVVPLGDVL